MKNTMRTFPIFSGIFGFLTVLWTIVAIRDYLFGAVLPWEDAAVRNEFFRVTGYVVVFFILFVISFCLESMSKIKFDENGITYKRKKYTWSEIGYIKEVYIRGHRGHNQYVIVGAKGEAICVYNDTFTNRKHFNEYLSKKNIGTNYSSK